MGQSFDFIVAGAGAAGRSFVYQLLQSPLRDKTVLLIDRLEQRTNDRTWCYWETTPGPFEAVVHHSWSHLWFYQGDVAKRMDIAPFTYKMVHGADYYAFTDQAFDQAPNVTRIYGEITSFQTEGEQVVVEVNGERFTGSWGMSSLFQGTIDKREVNYLDQHFRGWFIETEQPYFNPSEGVLMDFRIPQEQDFRFLYVLPNSPTTALVEVAIFSNEHLDNEGYDRIISDYLKNYWPDLPPYAIKRTENGNIPMTDYSFTREEGRIVYLGTAGGDTRASTGYTFLYIHRRVATILESLQQKGHPYAPLDLAQRRHQEYDRLMLRVLEKSGYPGADLFGQLFAKNPPQRMLRFLNGESTVAEELAVMATAPTGVFLKALWQEKVGEKFRKY